MYENLHLILFLVLHVYVHVQVHDEVSSADNCIQNVPVYVTVACFLASEGADLEIESLEGLTPLRLCPPDYLSLLKLFARPERYSSMYSVLDIQWNLSNPDTIGAEVSLIQRLLSTQMWRLGQTKVSCLERCP